MNTDPMNQIPERPAMSASPSEKAVKALPAHIQRLLNQNNTADSAGVPWQGRNLEDVNFQDDDGLRDPAYDQVRASFTQGTGTEVDVLEALRSTRLLIPIVAELGEEAEGEQGLAADKSADMAMVTIAAPDGRRTLPVFTSMEAMRRWNPEARPVPVEAGRAALSAVAEGAELMVVDPGEPDYWLVRRPALWALAQGIGWIPAPANLAVREAFEESVAGEPDIRSATLTPAATMEQLRAGMLGAVEVRVQLGLRPGLDQTTLQALLARVQDRWVRDGRFAELVDSMEVKVVQAAF